MRTTTLRLRRIRCSADCGCAGFRSSFYGAYAAAHYCIDGERIIEMRYRDEISSGALAA